MYHIVLVLKLIAIRCFIIVYQELILGTALEREKLVMIRISILIDW